MLEALIGRWGYLGVGFGTLLEGEAVLLAAGALAHKGLLAFPGVCLAAFVGTALADQAWFWVGRLFGTNLLKKRPQIAAQSARVQRWVERYGSGFVVSVRFLYGLRTASVVWLGSSGYSYPHFTLLDLIGAALWSLGVGAIGWGVGATLKALLGRPGHVEELLIGAAVLALLSWCAMRLRRRARTSPHPKH